MPVIFRNLSIMIFESVGMRTPSSPKKRLSQKVLISLNDFRNITSAAYDYSPFHFSLCQKPGLASTAVKIQVGANCKKSDKNRLHKKIQVQDGIVKKNHLLRRNCHNESILKSYNMIRPVGKVFDQLFLFSPIYNFQPYSNFYFILTKKFHFSTKS